MMEGEKTKNLREKPWRGACQEIAQNLSLSPPAEPYTSMCMLLPRMNQGAP